MYLGLCYKQQILTFDLLVANLLTAWHCDSCHYILQLRMVSSFACSLTSLPSARQEPTLPISTACFALERASKSDIQAHQKRLSNWTRTIGHWNHRLLSVLVVSWLSWCCFQNHRKQRVTDQKTTTGIAPQQHFRNSEMPRPNSSVHWLRPRDPQPRPWNDKTRRRMAQERKRTQVLRDILNFCDEWTESKYASKRIRTKKRHPYRIAARDIHTSMHIYTEKEREGERKREKEREKEREGERRREKEREGEREGERRREKEREGERRREKEREGERSREKEKERERRREKERDKEREGETRREKEREGERRREKEREGERRREKEREGERRREKEREGERRREKEREKEREREREAERRRG